MKIQYILNKKEFDNLESKKYYNNLRDSFLESSSILIEEVCLINKGQKYCDKCPIKDLFWTGRTSRRRYCMKDKNFSK